MNAFSRTLNFTMKHQQIDQYAASLRPDKRAAVYDGTKSGYDARLRALNTSYPTPDNLRRLAGQIKQHTIENLDTYLPQAGERLAANGVKVHWALDAAEACAHVQRIMEEHGAKKMVKAKTMVSEEIGLAAHLEKRGMECLETDLGEFIIQIDHDHPSHIVKPIIHKNRREIATSFEKNGLGAYNDDPEVITARARQFMRHKYLAADVGLSGANFVSAESGRIVLVTNEGNSRFSIAATKVHIALVGIEKIVPRDRDLGVFLNLLARSATGQQLTSYTEFISGPRGASQPDGPREMHVIFVDNGRSRVLADDCRAILRCIRCSACLNVCPVYRQASGHAYRAVYPGPVGSVLSPLFAGEKFAEMADLPKACTLCAACNEVCPVNIPIPDLLLRLRDRGKLAHSEAAAAATPPMGAFGTLASHPGLWKTALKTGGMSALYPTFLMPSYGKAWVRTRGLPAWRGGKFRKWLKKHRANAASPTVESSN